MKTIDKIITKVNGKYGAPMGRLSEGKKPTDGTRIFDCAVPMSSDGAYDKGGAYWGFGNQLRVEYTKDLSYIHFYRRGQVGDPKLEKTRPFQRPILNIPNTNLKK